MRRERRARRSLFRSVFGALATVAVASACGASHGGSAMPPPSGINRILQRLTQVQRSGAVALLETRGGEWRDAAGRAAGGKPAAVGDRFGIESVTKTFVAAVVLQLVDEGRLSLDDTIERWLPRQVRDGRRITIRELLNHTSGLAQGMPTEFQPLREQPALLFRPGSAESYANLNYAVLGAIIEKVTHRRLDRVVGDRVFEPLHLTATSFGPTHESGAAPPAWLGFPEVRAVPVTGDVGIVSTTADLATFYSALLGGKLVPKAELAAMERTVGTGTDPQAGLGVFRWSLPCGIAWGHGGNDSGYSDQVFASPDASTVVVVAQNTLNETATSDAAAAIFCAARKHAAS